MYKMHSEDASIQKTRSNTLYFWQLESLKERPPCFSVGWSCVSHEGMIEVYLFYINVCLILGITPFYIP